MRNPFMDREGKRRFSVPAIIAMSLGGAALAAGLALFFGWIVMLLWNWLMPAIFRLPTISYWQGWGLVLLSHILIKPGFGAGPRGHGPRGDHEWKRRMGGNLDHGRGRHGGHPDADTPSPEGPTTTGT